MTTSRPAAERKLRERIYALVDSKSNPAGGLRPLYLLGVIANTRKVVAAGSVHRIRI
jgi:hypothetical protein